MNDWADQPGRASTMLLRSYLGVMGLRGLSQLLALLYVALVTALVSPDEFGRFNLVLSVAQVLGAALLSWPNQALLRYGREDLSSHGSFGSVLGARLTLHGGLLLVILPLVFALAPRLAELTRLPGENLAAILCLLLLAFPAADLANVVAQITQRFMAYGLSPLIQRSAQIAVLGVVLLGVPMAWDILIWGTVAGYGVAALAVGLLVPKTALRPMFVEGRQIQRLLSYSWAMPLASLSAFLMSQMGLWFLGHFEDVAAVGVYAWAFNLSLLATSLLVPLSAILAPRTIDLRVANRQEELLGFVQLCSSAIVLAAALLPAGIGILAWLAPMLPLGDYRSAIGPLLIFAAGAVFQLGMALMEPVMFAHERLVTPTVLLIVGMALLSAALNLVLIPVWGMTGAALAVAAAYALGMVVEWLAFVPKLAVGPRYHPVWTCLMAALPMAMLPVLAQTAPWGGLVTGLAGSMIMLGLGRGLRLFSGLGVVKPRLQPAWRPLVAWLAVSG